MYNWNIFKFFICYFHKQSNILSFVIYLKKKIIRTWVNKNTFIELIVLSYVTSQQLLQHNLVLGMKHIVSFSIIVGDKNLWLLVQNMNEWVTNSIFKGLLNIYQKIFCLTNNKINIRFLIYIWDFTTLISSGKAL